MPLSSEIVESLTAPPSSVLLAVRPPRVEAAGVSDVERLLAAAGLAPESVRPVAVETSAQARWEAAVEVRFSPEADPSSFNVWLEPVPREMLEQILMDEIEWRGLLPEDRQDAHEATWAMGVSAQIERDPLFGFHGQTRVLDALAPDAVFVMDVSSVTPHPGDWLREIAHSRTPPAPEALYTIHCVGDGDRAERWLHTHGLSRCGAIELDMLEVPFDLAGLAGHLLNVVGAMFIETGVPAPDEPFLGGQDLSLVWLPWKEGARKVSSRAPGGLRDRDDGLHCGGRGILFAPSKGLLGGRKYKSPAVYRETLEGNPLFYVSKMETDRAAMLARERFDRFSRLFHQYAGSGEEWLFLVKLGYPVDDARTDNDREHLWFEVHALREEDAEATLLNQPYAIGALREGMRGLHGLDKLTSWAILCTHGRFDPDTVGELERITAAD